MIADMNTPPGSFVRTLAAAIDLAVEVITRPASLPRHHAVVAMTERVDADRAVMVEGGNPIRGEVSMLLETLAHIEAERSSRDDRRASDWRKVAGVLLPMVQDNLAAVMDLHSARPATTDQDRRSGGTHGRA